MPEAKTEATPATEHWRTSSHAAPEGSAFTVAVYANDAEPGDKMPAVAYGRNKKTALARARLIAAAPKLLAAAKAALDDLYQCGCDAATAYEHGDGAQVIRADERAREIHDLLTAAIAETEK